jgi:hypothetical protein
MPLPSVGLVERTSDEDLTRQLALGVLVCLPCSPRTDERRMAHRGELRRQGIPRLTCVRERVVFIEVKSDKGKLSPDQKRWIEMLDEGARAVVYVLRPSDWQIIEETFGR